MPRPESALRGGVLLGLSVLMASSVLRAKETQLTHAAWHHELDNNDNFSPDSRWLVFDRRDAHTAIAGNAVIGRVELATGREEIVYRSPRSAPFGPGVGAANVNPRDGSVAFIRGFDEATAEEPYELWRRGGAWVETGGESAGFAWLDARDVHAPFTPGALRGGTHRHEWSADGQWIGFTYNDAVLAEHDRRTGSRLNLRTVGVATWQPDGVRVPEAKGNHDGAMRAAVVVNVTPHPRPGSDEISRAFEDAWVGRNGYRRADGSWQARARAFLGQIKTKDGRDLVEVFIVDVPSRLDVAGPDGPLEGGLLTMPAPPAGTVQRRLTFTENCKHPGVALLPRHWVRSSPDGTRIVFLAADEQGVVQAFLVSPTGGPIVQVTRESHSLQSCVRWSPDGRHLLYVADNTVKRCGALPSEKDFGVSQALTLPSENAPESPIWSPDGRRVAFNRLVASPAGEFKQIAVVEIAVDDGK